MSEKNIFNNLFIFEMANNHMGSIDHGIKIIKAIKEATNDFGFNFGFKLQYRHLDSFIHPDYMGRQEIKYVKRFSETRLEPDQFLTLKKEIVNAGFIPICTPFDEKSVDLIEEHNFEIIKIASCSFTDWPLLEKIAETDRSIIASTAGASFDDIDRVVSFFTHRKKNFCLMHCVGEYPTPKKNLELNQISVLKERYPDIYVGYSTHESPDNYDSIKIVIGKGVTVFEKHVGIKTEEYDINDYSATPDQAKSWLTSAKDAFEMCTTKDNKREFSKKAISDLRGLKRGVFVKESIKKGDKLSPKNTFLAIPCQVDQILANDLSKYTEYVAIEDLALNEAIMQKTIEESNLREKVLKIIEEVRRLLIDSKIKLPNRLDFELSHHYGIDGFNDWGATIINCINREYCKKIIILLPGQKHPIHHHKRKEETFHVVHGDLEINLNGETKSYKDGDIVIVERGVKHSFSSKNGAIFEEVSTTHYKDDSYYDEVEIHNNMNRKTEMTFWSDWLYKPVS